MVHHTVRGTYGTPEAGTRTAHVRWRTSCPAPLVRTARRRPVHVARTYSTEAPGRTCKLRLQAGRGRSRLDRSAADALDREGGKLVEQAEVLRLDRRGERAVLLLQRRQKRRQRRRVRGRDECHGVAQTKGR